MTSKIKVDNIEDTSGNAVVTKCGSTLTIGKTGDTISLASGASQTGFGRSGSVDWQTGSIKTTTFTAVSGEGYFVDTSSGAVTVNLPAGSAGAIVSVADYTRTFQTNSCTISPNGSEKLGGISADGVLNQQGQTATFVYVDATEGWINVQETSATVTGNANLVATGGTITTCGDYKIHTFTSPGTFSVSQVSSVCSAHNTVSYLVIAGGGAGGNSGGGDGGGGGGAGGYREYRSPVSGCYSVSPLNGNPGGTAVTVTATAYPITVGAGGTTQSAPNCGVSGSNSVFSTITSNGGGGGAKGSTVGTAGGSGGGSGGGVPGGGTTAGAGNTPPTTPSQGFPGGLGGGGSPNYTGGGGGGATAAGTGGPSSSSGGNGGAGATTSIDGTPTQRAGGGGGSTYSNPGSPGSFLGGSGGAGGGGAAQTRVPTWPTAAVAGTTNTGSGGGGGQCAAANGGSGLVIIRYKFQ